MHGHRWRIGIASIAGHHSARDTVGLHVLVTLRKELEPAQTLPSPKNVGHRRAIDGIWTDQSVRLADCSFQSGEVSDDRKIIADDWLQSLDQFCLGVGCP